MTPGKAYQGATLQRDRRFLQQYQLCGLSREACDAVVHSTPEPFSHFLQGFL